MRNSLIKKGLIIGIILFVSTIISQSKQINVSYIGPIADAGGPYNGTNEYTIQFNGSGSYDPDGTIVTYLWIFGDNDKGWGVNTTHKYEKPGLYNVTLIVTDNDGIKDSDITTVNVSKGNPPTIQLIYPVGGEVLNGTIPVKWYAHDTKDGVNLSIYIYYKVVNIVIWSKFPSNPYPNIGICEWDTTTLFDGNYTISIYAYDKDNNVEKNISWQFQVLNHLQPPENYEPEKPSQPSGPINGKTNVSYRYESSTTDRENDKIFYLFDWGDGTASGWMGPYNSGDTCTELHKWSTKGSYNIKVKAKDIYGKESVWSDPLPVTMPYIYNPIHQHKFFKLFFERFSSLFPMLNLLTTY